MHQVNVEEFEGPLDLLLQLIEDNDFDITKISLANVTDQYVSYMQEIEEYKPVELADFLVIAAKLLYIKSKALMPYLIFDEDDDEGDLEKQLKLYKEFLDASKKMQKMMNNKNFTFIREKPLVNTEVMFSPPKKIEKNKLAEVYADVLAKLEPIFTLPRKLIEKTISIKEKIFQIKELISGQKSVSFNHVVEISENRTEVIVGFLAVLEMVKQKEVILHQTAVFEEIVIEAL